MTHAFRRPPGRTQRLLNDAARRDAAARGRRREKDERERAEEDAAALPPALEWQCPCGHVETVEIEFPPVPEGAVQECTECDDGEAVAVPS